MKHSAYRRDLLLVATAFLTGCAAIPSPQTAIGAAPAPLAAAPLADDAARAWGFAASDVVVDPNVRFGVLPNGMKYALLKNTTPKDNVAVRLRIDMGSLFEAEDQRGLAHFLEHMAFNGSTNVPEGEMVKLLERKGLAFGPDTNAYTNFEETVYQLDLPHATDDLIDTGLMLMRETGGALTIGAAAVDRERGVVQSERRLRDTYQLRSFVDQMAFLYPNLLAKDRFPIGTEQVLTSAPPERIRALYEAYYRPERATLVLVGDFDVDAVEAKVKARFADWQGRGSAGGEPAIGTIDVNRPAAASSFIDPAIVDMVTVTRFKPWAEERDTRAQRVQDLAASIGEAIVSRRLDKAALAADAPILAGFFQQARNWNVVDEVGVGALAKEGAWADALALVEQELRRAEQFGFTQSEVSEALANFRTANANAVAGAETRRSDALVNGLVRASRGDVVFTRPEWGRDLFEATAPSLSPARVGAAFRSRMAGYGPALVRVTAKKPIAGGDAAILAALNRSVQTAVVAPAAQSAQRFAYTDFGPAGRVVADDRIDDLGIRRVRFANNVMLNIKRTDFQADTVLTRVRVDGGNLLGTRGDPTRVALGNAISFGGLEAHSADDLRSALAGRTVDAGWSSSADGFGNTARSSPGDLLLQAQVMAAFLTHPGWRPEGLALIRRYLPQVYAGQDATPGALMARDVDAILADNDPREATPPLATMMALDWDGIKSASAEVMAHGAIEIAIVGDVDEAAAIAAIAATFGALPERRAAFGDFVEARTRTFAKDRTLRTLVHKGPAEQAELRLYWPARDDSDLNEAMQVELLARVMQLQLTDELRERLGKSYGPGAGADLSFLYPGYGHVMVAANVDFADLATTQAAMMAIGQRLRDAPVDADLINRARQPMVEQMTKARRENGYWLAYAGRASSRPDRLDRARKSIAAVEAVSAADLQRMAQRYLRDDRVLAVRAISDKAGATK